jgi:hypothetical protein
MWRAAAYSVPGLLAVFLGLFTAAAWHYPGGTWDEPQRLGHSFWGNYFCDLMRPIALNGQVNGGAQLAEWAQLTFALCLLPFFLVAPRAFAPERPRLARAVRGLGPVASLAGVGVVLMPSWRYGQTVHGIMLLICAVPALCSLVLTGLGTWRLATLRALALALLLALLLTLGIFARQIAVGAETTPGLAPLQRLDFALALAWMCAVALIGARTGGPTAAFER